MSESATSRGGPRAFPVTQWTVVLAAGATPSPESAAALERLCQAYWYPLYAFVRRSGYAPADAEDLAQEFFARLLEHNWVAYADRHRGRFRSFLLMAMKRFLANEWNKAKAQKRGGRVRLVPLESHTAETRYQLEPADTRTPGRIAAAPAGGGHLWRRAWRRWRGFSRNWKSKGSSDRGGMGAVYKARQKELDRVVALKVLPLGVGKEPAFAERFTREARALAKLSHSGIVTLYEFGKADGLFFLLMEFVDGMSLRGLLEVGRVSAREALAIMPQICDALQYAHDSVEVEVKQGQPVVGPDFEAKTKAGGGARQAAGGGRLTEAEVSAVAKPKPRPDQLIVLAQSVGYPKP